MGLELGRRQFLAGAIAAPALVAATASQASVGQPVYGPLPPLNVTELGIFSYGATGSAGFYDVYVRSLDKQLFVSTQRRGSLMRFDVSNPANIRFVAESERVFPTGGRWLATPDSGRTIFMCSDKNALQKFDCSSALTPILTGILKDSTKLRGAVALAIDDEVAFVGCVGPVSTRPPGILTSCDISGKNPVCLQSISHSLLLGCQNVAVAGNYVLTTSPDGVNGNISVWNKSNPAAMFLTDTKFRPGCLAVLVNGYYVYLNWTQPDGHYLDTYLLNQQTGVLTFIGTTIMPVGVAQRMIKAENYLWGSGQYFMTNFQTSGIWACDISNPASPVLAFASAQNQSEARGLWFARGGSVLYQSEDTGSKLHTYALSPTKWPMM